MTSHSVGPFRTRDALLQGDSRARLRRTNLTAPIHGVRVDTGIEVDLVESVAIVLRSDQVFSHITAARLWRCPLPRRLDDETSVHVTTIGNGPVMRRPQVRGHRVTPERADVRELRGLRVSSPARMWSECASVLDVVELVVLGDHLVGPSGLATIDDLAAVIRGGDRRAGIARLALDRIRVGSASPMETEVRLLVLDAGFPEPELNLDVHDARGHFLGRVDMAWPEYRIALEYDGDQHRDRAQYQHDQRRGNGFAVNGWLVIHATAVDAHRPAIMFERLRQAFAQRHAERRAVA